MVKDFIFKRKILLRPSNYFYDLYMCIPIKKIMNNGCLQTQCLKMHFLREISFAVTYFNFNVAIKFSDDIYLRKFHVLLTASLILFCWKKKEKKIFSK